MREGPDSDAIRAIKELNAMDEREQVRGGGEQTEFNGLVMMIAGKRRVLPFQDEDDRRMLELDPDLPRPI